MTKEEFFVFLEATVGKSFVFRDTFYPKIEAVLGTPIGDKKFKQIVGSYLDNHSMELHTSGPVYKIAFGDIDKTEYFRLFGITANEVKEVVQQITRKISATAEFKLLLNNPIFWIFILCIRYYDLQKDKKGLNSALAIYALSVYPSVMYKYFPHGADEGVMQYTMDTLSNKFIMKKEGHVFGGLFVSIQHAYDNGKSDSHRNRFKELPDSEIIAFIQRVRNDQNAMLKNIKDQFQINYQKGNRVRITKDNAIEDIGIDVTQQNNTTIIEVITQSIVNQILSNGLDLNRVFQCKGIANIGLADCRFYLSRVISNRYQKEIEAFIQSVLFLYLNYGEIRQKTDINSSHFLVWASELFRKTNSNDENIRTIKTLLDKWGSETGIHDKFKREGSRICYKKAIFWYFILSIQYYNH